MNTSAPVRSVGERITLTLAFEAIGLVVITPAYRAATGATYVDSLTLMFAVSMVAALWCFVFDAFFDWAERCRFRLGAWRRQPGLRLLQGAVREATEIPMTFPLIYVLTGMNWLDSLMTDMALAAVYAVYGWVFFTVVDRLYPATGAVAAIAAEP